MNDDTRLAQMLVRLGHDPTAEFRAALREHLVDEATGRRIVPIDVESPHVHRRHGRPGWLVVGAVAAATVLVVAGLVVVTRRDDRSPADQPDVFPPPTLDDLTDRVWVNPDLGLVRVPTLSFEATGTDGVYAVEQFDGCNQGSGTVTLDSGDVVGAEIASTKIGCAFDQPTRLAAGAAVSVDIDNLGRLRLLVTDGDATTSYVALDSLPAVRTAAEMRNTWWHPATGATTFTPNGRLSDSGRLAVGIGSCDTTGTIDNGYLTTTEPIDERCIVDPAADQDLVGRLADGTSRWYRYDELLLMASERGVDLFDVYSTLMLPPGDDTTDEVAVDAFIDAVTGRTFVLLPDGDDTAIDRPYITFGDPSDPRTGLRRLDRMHGLLRQGNLGIA
jgi:hypothetical protein